MALAHSHFPFSGVHVTPLSTTWLQRAFLLLLAAVLVPGPGEVPASEQHFLRLETHRRLLPALRSQALGCRELMSHSGS